MVQMVQMVHEGEGECIYIFLLRGYILDTGGRSAIFLSNEL